MLSSMSDTLSDSGNVMLSRSLWGSDRQRSGDETGSRSLSRDLRRTSTEALPERSMP